jgi:hypothetical protein
MPDLKPVDNRVSALVVRRRSCAVSNHEAQIVAPSFETQLALLLRMRECGRWEDSNDV